jgi:pimeloyl-ACP methyl ester carboxylesterase
MLSFKSLLTILVAYAIPAFASATDDFFDANGVKIRYVTAGEGEPVVLIHGWLADATMWGRDAAGNPKLAAKDGYQLIALDCRGHGKSDKLYDPSKYGIEMATDVVRLLDHLKIRKAHLIGYSMGAFIAGNVAATHPDRVLSVIYGGQAPLLVGRETSGSNEVEVFAKAVEEGKGLGPYLIEVMPAGLTKPTLEQANKMAEYLYRGKDVKALAAAGLSLGKLEVRADDLKKCTAPTLFMHGGNESDYVKNSVTAVRKVLPNSQLVIVDGADHMTTLTKPKFSSTIIEFLQSVKAASAFTKG